MRKIESDVLVGLGLFVDGRDVMWDGIALRHVDVEVDGYVRGRSAIANRRGAQWWGYVVGADGSRYRRLDDGPCQALSALVD